MSVQENKETTGLLIVDLQKNAKVPEAVVRRIEAAIPQYRQVVMTRWLVSAENPLWERHFDFERGIVSPLVLPVPKGGALLDKPGYGLTGPALEQIQQISRSMGLDSWDVAGVETDACVLASCYTLWDVGLRPVLKEELCWSRSAERHAAAVKIAAQQFCLQDS